MKAMMTQERKPQPTSSMSAHEKNMLNKKIEDCWSKIAPFWPLKNLIAVNPTAGFEDLSFEDALHQAQAYFQQDHLPKGMQAVNRETIKWLQVFFDTGQSTIPMPNRHLGFLHSMLSLIRFDKHIHRNDKPKQEWLSGLSENPETIILDCLHYLDIPESQHVSFLTLMLTTLPGWAAHVQYCVNWNNEKDSSNTYDITHNDYLAFRLLLTCLIWPKAIEILQWHQQALENADCEAIIEDIQNREAQYQKVLLNNIPSITAHTPNKRPRAQLVFCIDVRSEPFRRAIESQGDYETYGFAGFFGVPVAIENGITGETHASCPVLLKPAHSVREQPTTASHHACLKGHHRLQGIKRVYQSVKYTFTTPFSLAETMGLMNGVWMGIKSLSPKSATIIQSYLSSKIAAPYQVRPDIQSIPFEKQVAYGTGALKTMGLIDNFAPLVVLCGHGSTTQNNAYASALDCGACGGRQGAPNARILATILNATEVRQALSQAGINIPTDTHFIAAEHNTTTDAVELYPGEIPEDKLTSLDLLQEDLDASGRQNAKWRSQTLEGAYHSNKKGHSVRAHDWAQVRPEWGLARNAAFIIAPRALTKEMNLEGRSFLHSYNWEKDHDGSALTAILTAPMIVTQWINAQYLFSTLDNVAFGGGSKITKNITGKMGIMQGNASDLMHGLPLQSVFHSDTEHYHEAVRLSVVIHAPKTLIDPIIHQHEILKKLFGNGWVHLVCHEPQTGNTFRLKRDLTWVSTDQLDAKNLVRNEDNCSVEVN
jgi:hypothetical protein